MKSGKGLSRQEQLEAKVSKLEKEVARLKDVLNVKDNWHAEVKGLIGKVVHISGAATGQLVIGKLLWTDRYHMCVHVTKDLSDPKKGCLEHRVIICKGTTFSITTFEDEVDERAPE